LGLQLRNKTPKRRVRAKLRDDRRPATRSNETWAMDFVHDQLATGTSSGCLPSSISFPASRPRWSRGSPSVAPTSWRYLKGSAMKWDSRQRSVSIKAASSSRGILTCGPISAELRWTSHGRASPRIMHSSKRSTVASGLNASTPTGSCLLRTPEKSGRALICH
jgi:putative transposase